jgi:hypothetical protein
MAAYPPKLTSTETMQNQKASEVYLDSERALLANIPARAAHIHLEGSAGHHPRLLVHVPVGDVATGEREGGLAVLAGRERQLLESSQLLGRRQWRAVGKPDVELGDFGAGDGAAVFHVHGDGADATEAFLVASGNDRAQDDAGFVVDLDLELGVGEVGVRWNFCGD